MARVRSFLIDNTTGRILTGVTSSKITSADSILASKKQLSKSVSQNAKASVSVTQNLGGSAQGIVLSPEGGIVSQLVMSVANKGKNTGTITIRLKKGTSYDTSTTVGTYSMSVPTTGSAVFNINNSYNTSESYWIDIITVPKIVGGPLGLSIQFNYY